MDFANTCPEIQAVPELTAGCRSLGCAEHRICKIWEAQLGAAGSWRLPDRPMRADVMV